ncbi:MAG: T9SS type A sorting domain-containing protein [Ignavibacteriae bacterium]|nr:T9SS type A sorting domain-containing protein [Ignavibacteriota bacterium]
MKRLLYIVLLLAMFTSVNLCAQSIKIVRTDVDSTRAHFITATFRFGVDITLEDSPGCTGAAFELRYTNASVVRFSGWSAGSFGSRGTIQVDQTDLTTVAGRISVGSLSGDPAYARGTDNPVVVHFDFVVMPDAIHNQTSVFSFVNAQAIINKDSGTIVQLTSNSTPLAIRSFIKVWPGDADNNGIVDTRDASQIGRFIGNNDSITMFRGFKRQPGSTFWSPQTALAWDSAQATFADCDGNGDVTLADLMIVPLNHGKVVSETKGAIPLTPIRLPDNTAPVYPPNSEKIPIFVSTDRPFLAASAEVTWNTTDDEILGIEPGELFCGKDLMLYSNIFEQKHSALLAIGALDGCQAEHGGILAYLIINPRRPGVPPYPMLQTPTGITASGLFFPLQSVSAVKGEFSNDNDFIIRKSDKLLSITFNNPQNSSVTIINVLGQNLIHKSVMQSESSAEIDVSALAQGIYFVLITSGQNTYCQTFVLP